MPCRQRRRGIDRDAGEPLRQALDQDDLVVLYVRFTGTHTGTFTVAGRTLPPTNRAIDETETIMARVANGKIVESWATWDRLSLLERLGAIANGA